MKTRVLIENCGEFVKIIQPSSGAEIMIGSSEWPYIRDAINIMCAATLTKYQPCGCVICTCEHETQCQGCGAKYCVTHRNRSES